MPPQLKRHALAVKHRGRVFLASLWRFRLWLVHPKRGLGFTITMALGALVFGFGVFDSVSGLTGDHRDAPGQVAETRDEPGAPVLMPGDRVTGLLSLSPFGSLATAAISGGDTLTPVAPGIQGVNMVAACTTNPSARNVPNPDVHKLIAIHSSEEMAGAAGASAVCRYHAVDLGWGGAGYHLYIRYSDGLVYRLLPDSVQPWAQKRENQGVAIVLQGRANTAGFPSDAQMATLNRLVPAIARQYGIPAEHVYAHHDFSVMDQALLNAGQWVGDRAEVNDHMDVGTSWDQNQWGLRDAVRAAVSPRYDGYRPAQPRDPNGGPLIGSTVAGVSLTYYGAETTGAPRCPHPSGPETAGLPWPTWNPGGISDPHWAASYVLADGTPAWPCGTWLRLTVDASHHLDVRIADTGSFKPMDPANGSLPNHLLDLSQAASQRLLGRPGNATGVTIEVISVDDGFARYVAETGYTVVGAFREPYFLQKPPFGATLYGLPLEDANYSRWADEAIVTQRFRLATFTYQNGVVTITR